jgi:hypothetical protein
MIIYAHGLQLSPSDVSSKGRILSDKLGAIVPTLPIDPDAAIDTLERQILNHSKVMLVGHSLGGFYMSYLAEKYDLPVMLTNPVIKPHKSHLLDGIVSNDEILKKALAAKLAAYDVPITKPNNFWVMLQRADDVLNYQDALEHYQHCNFVVLNGGSHKFDDFQYWLPIIKYFQQRHYRGFTHD